MEAREVRSGRFRRSLAVRVAALVLLVLIAAGVLSIAMLGQLRAFRARFDLLTEVYVVFNQRLSEANQQATRIHEQVRTRSDTIGVQPLDPVFIQRFEDALRTRDVQIAKARAPLEQALADTQRYGGAPQLEEVEELRSMVRELQQLADTEGVEPEDVLADVQTQYRITKLFKQLSGKSEEAVEVLAQEVRQAQTRTERLTVGLTLATIVVGFLASVGVFLTLRPLRQLAASVRNLGRGDWGQRVVVSGSRRGDEVSQLALEFNLMAEALEERERRLLRGERLAAAGQLAAQITHEIRNPLSSVALNVELLEDEIAESSVEGRHLLVEITKEIDRLNQVTEDYLAFARRPPPEFGKFDLREELQSLIDFMRPELELGDIELVIDLPSEPVRVRGDPGQLRQALMNLIRNAQEAVIGEERDEDRAPRIAIGMECKDDQVLVVVEDNGPGIALDEDQLERIFEAFYTRKARGTGLGLPTVQQILTDHGGGVAVASTSARGTRFEVSLPLAPQDAGP